MTVLLTLAEPDAAVVLAARIAAGQMTWDGRDSPAARRHLQRCTFYDRPTQTQLIFTRESGYHSGGWWKNPDYERCYHLSLSMKAIEGGMRHALPFNTKVGAKWVRAFFGDDCALVWHEPPHTNGGKLLDVHHYRLFCDEAWQPIKPRGEVYSKDWTPAGWQSFSEVTA